VSSAPDDDASATPLLRVVRGQPTAEELAALIAVVTARAAAADADPPRTRSTWADPSRQLRQATQHGPGAWRRSTLPG
jgi:hypothetical protein